MALKDDIEIIGVRSWMEFRDSMDTVAVVVEGEGLPKDCEVDVGEKMEELVA